MRDAQGKWIETAMRPVQGGKMHSSVSTASAEEIAKCRAMAPEDEWWDSDASKGGGITAKHLNKLLPRVGSVFGIPTYVAPDDGDCFLSVKLKEPLTVVNIRAGGLATSTAVADVGEPAPPTPEEKAEAWAKVEAERDEAPAVPERYRYLGWDPDDGGMEEDSVGHVFTRSDYRTANGGAYMKHPNFEDHILETRCCWERVLPGEDERPWVKPGQIWGCSGEYSNVIDTREEVLLVENSRAHLTDNWELKLRDRVPLNQGWEYVGEAK